MINSNVQSQLARLLAKENIEIRHGEYHTAFFDVEQRVLGLPTWKDKGKDVYDLLVGHEVGHALNTPAEGWHESVIKLGVPRSYVNVVEDIRIEKKIQRTYPGLIGSFQRGYQVLFNENFFGTDDTDFSDYNLIDRINVKAKLGRLVDVPFSLEEQPLVKKAMSVESWADVLDVCKLLMEYAKENEEQEEANDEDTNTDPSQAPEGMGEPQDQQGSEAGEQDDQEDSQEQRAAQPEGLDAPEEQDSMDDSSATDQFRSVTDEAFRENEKELLEDLDGKPTTFPQVTQKQVESSIKDIDEILDNRKKSDEARMNYAAWRCPGWEGDWDKFMTETKSIVNIMAKEFEMRKAAFQYARAQEAKTGSINPLKLHSYKYNEDIFNRVLNLADAKSHGLVMFIDYSGSMHGTIFQVLQQTICLAQFCKKVNIPFEVYSFTTCGWNNEGGNIGAGTISMENVGINRILSSKMKKADYQYSIKSLYLMGATQDFVGIESMGATPLNETIMAAHTIVPKFQLANGVQKVTTVFLTDGEASSFNFGTCQSDTEREHRMKRWAHGFNIKIGNRVIECTSRVGVTSQLLKSLKEVTGSSVVGFFVAERQHDFRDFLLRRGVPYDTIAELRKKYNREKSVRIENLGGYEELYMIKGGQALDATNDEFEVKEDAKKGDITRAFKKFANSKKSNRIIMSAFAKKVA